MQVVRPSISKYNHTPGIYVKTQHFPQSLRIFAQLFCVSTCSIQHQANILALTSHVQRISEDKEKQISETQLLNYKYSQNVCTAHELADSALFTILLRALAVDDTPETHILCAELRGFCSGKTMSFWRLLMLHEQRRVMVNQERSQRQHVFKHTSPPVVHQYRNTQYYIMPRSLIQLLNSKGGVQTHIESLRRSSTPFSEPKATDRQ